MAWSKVLNFTEPGSYTAAIRAADMEILPTTTGEFRAELTQVTLKELWMQRFSENLPRVHKGAITARPQRIHLSYGKSARGLQPWQGIVAR